METRMSRNADGTKPAAAAYLRRLADLKAATREVGSDEQSRLGWLVRLARRDDIDHVHSAELTTLGDCLIAIAVVAVPENVQRGLVLPASLKPDAVRTLHGE